MPDAVVPALDWEAIRELFPVAITIAVLGAIESLLSATVADGVIGDRHDSNTELIAQGAANIIAPLFGGIPATGAIARTMTNINNGGKTPIAGIIHAVVLLLILLFLMPLAQYIPMACLAGVLVIVSYNMSGWRVFRALLKNPKSGRYRTAYHVLPDRYLRPDCRYRGRIGHCLRPLYEACHGDYRNLGDYRRD